MATIPVPAKPTIQYPTPDVADRIVIEQHDHKLASYGPRNAFTSIPSYGVSHPGATPPDRRNLTGFKLALIRPVDGADQVYAWYWVNERNNESAFNAERTYPYGDPDYPRVIRTQVILRSAYDELALGTADPVYSDLKLVEQKQSRPEDPVLDSLFVIVQRVYEKVPGPTITAPAVVNGNIAEVSTTQPVLLSTSEALVSQSGDLAESKVEAINSYVGKHTEVSGASWENSAGTRITDATWGVPSQVTEQVLDVGQAYVLPVVDKGLVSFQVSADGANRVRVTSESVEWPDLTVETLGSANLIPAKFRAAEAYTETIEKVDPGTAPTALSSTVVESFVRQETANRAERHTTTREAGAYPELEGYGIVDGREVTVTESLVDDGTALPTGFLILDSEQTPLGNGKSTLRQVAVDAFQTRTSYRLGELGKLEKETRTIVAPGTKPTGGTYVKSDIVRAIDDFRAEQIKTEIVNADGTTLTAFPIVQRDYRDPETNALLREFRQLKAAGTTLTNAIGDEYPSASSRYIIEAELSPIEGSDKLLWRVVTSNLPADRTTYPKFSFEFPAIFTFNYATVTVADTTYPHPWPGVDYTYKAHRKITKACKAVHSYTLGPSTEPLPEVFSVTSPGAGSRIFGRVLKENTIHPAFEVDETIGSSTFTVEDIEASTPSSYDNTDPIVVFADEKPWKGNIYERLVCYMVEVGDPHDITLGSSFGATGYYCTIPSTGYVGQTRRIRVYPTPYGSAFNGTTTISFSVSPTGGLGASSVTPIAGATSYSFTYVAPSTGVKTITTTNSAGWSDPAPMTITIS